MSPVLLSLKGTHSRSRQSTFRRAIALAGRTLSSGQVLLHCNSRRIASVPHIPPSLPSIHAMALLFLLPDDFISVPSLSLLSYSPCLLYVILTKKPHTEETRQLFSNQGNSCVQNMHGDTVLLSESVCPPSSIVSHRLLVPLGRWTVSDITASCSFFVYLPLFSRPLEHMRGYQKWTRMIFKSYLSIEIVDILTEEEK